MTTNPLVQELGTIIKPLENWAEQELESVGSALITSVGPIFNSFLPAQQRILTGIQAYWQAKHAAALAVNGGNELAAIETASTATLGEFIKEEGAEFNDLWGSFITTLDAAARAQLQRVEADTVTEGEKTVAAAFGEPGSSSPHP
jgi:hypothetical protein